MSLRHACAAAVAISIGLAVPAFAQPADPVVAVVNGTEITRSDVAEVHQSMPQLRQVPLEMVYDQIVEHLINSRLIVAAAREKDLHQDPEVKERLRQIENQLLQQAYLAKEIESQITEEALKKRYEEMVKTQPAREEVHARHILLPSEEAAKETIAAIEGGKDFAEVAKEKSTGPSAETGGDLGYFTKDEMVPEFAEAAFAMQPGEVTKEPVKTQFGWHVIKVEDKRTAPPPNFDEVEAELREQMGDELVAKVVEDLRAKADVKVTKPEPAAAAAPNGDKPKAQ